MFSLFKSKPYFNSKTAQMVFEKLSKDEQRNLKELADLFLKKFDTKLEEKKKLGLIEADVGSGEWLQEFLTNAAGLGKVGGWTRVDDADKDELIKICSMVGGIWHDFSKLLNGNKHVFMDIFVKNADGLKEVSATDFDKVFAKFCKDKYGIVVEPKSGELKISIKSHEYTESKLYEKMYPVGSPNDFSIITNNVTEYELEVYRTSELTYRISKILAG